MDKINDRITTIQNNIFPCHDEIEVSILNYYHEEEPSHSIEPRLTLTYLEPSTTYVCDDAFYGSYSVNVPACPFIFGDDNMSKYESDKVSRSIKATCKLSQHRVPLHLTLYDKIDPSVPNNHSQGKKKKGRKSVKQLLQKYTPFDEITAVKSELNKCRKELKAIMHDKNVFHSKLEKIKSSPTAVNTVGYSNDRFSMWDIDEILSRNKENANKLNNRKKQKNQINRKNQKVLTNETKGGSNITSQGSATANRLTHIQLDKLREKRGKYFRSYFEDENAEESLLSICNITGSKPKKIASDHLIKLPDICTLAITSNSKGSSFFVSYDDDTSNWYGNIPRRLAERAQREKVQLNNVRYFAVGPGGSYYAEFLNGECWWGISLEDEEFDQAMSDLDVCRVAFGAFPILQDDCGNVFNSTSWIIIGKDGRCAWKNLPSSLHKTLICRTLNDPAPGDVSLGKEGSYFVRFLDSKTQYCLPADLAQTVETMERNGSEVENIIFNSDSYDYIIRYSEHEE